jgi:hypothetical protein
MVCGKTNCELHTLSSVLCHGVGGKLPALIAETVVRSHAMLWEICGEQSGSETGFYPSNLSGIPLMLSSLIDHRGYIILAVVRVVT